MILKIGLVVYSILTIVFLVFAFLGKKTIIKTMKPFMVLVLMLFSIAYMKVRNNVNIYIVLALAFEVISASFLINNENKICFTLGTFGSLLSVIFYIIRIITWLPFKLKWYFYLILAIFFIVWSLLIYSKMKFLLGKLAIFYTIYSYILVCGLSMGLIVSLVKISIFSISLGCGFIGLIFSDCVLFTILFNKKVKKMSLYLMAPYSLSQICLLVGAIFI